MTDIGQLQLSLPLRATGDAHSGWSVQSGEKIALC